MKTKDNLKIIKNYLPFSLRTVGLPDNLQEIRLRANRPAVLYTDNKAYFLTNVLLLTEEYGDNLFVLSPKELAETFTSVCNYSVYSKQNEIVNGFVTLKGGNRAGICGTCVIQDGKIINIRDISSINIRIACERINCSDEFFARLSDFDGGVLLCGAPCSGKTTILRDIARKLSLNKKVSLIDSRGELAAVYGGIAQNDVGLCDVFDGYTKRDSFEQAVRCHSPDFIICDEIGADDDVASIQNACKSGVSVIASAHCEDSAALLAKPNLGELLKSRSFRYIVFLMDGENVGKIREIIQADELD